MFKFHFKICFLVFACLLFWNTTQAQNNFKAIANRIDSLADLGLPKSALQEVEKLETLARKNNQPAEIIRATICRITLISYVEEKSFNIIIDQLNKDIQTGTFPTKPVLQSLLAEIYWKYYQQNRWRFINRSLTSVLNDNIDTWDLQTIINQTSLLYHASLKEAKKEQDTPIDIFNDVLAGDKVNRYLRPSMYDLLVHRALDFFLADEPALTRPQLPFSLKNPDFFAPAEKFVQLKISDTDTASTFYQGMKYLQQASLFHLENKNEEALAELSIKRFEFLYRKSNFSKDSLYLSALDKIAQQYASKPISADALTLLGKYYQEKDSLLTALTYLEKAVQKHPNSVGGQNAQNLIQVIKAKNLAVKIEDIYTPGKPLLAKIEFKNVQNINVRVYKLNEDQLQAYYKALRQTFSINYDQKRILKTNAIVFLQAFQSIKDFDLTLPKTNDYKQHSTEFKLSALKPGNYVMLLNDVAQNDSSMLQLTDFKVSQLAYVNRTNPDHSTEIRIMDRESGKPLKGVSLSFIRKDKNGKDSVYKRGTSTVGGLYKSTTLDDKTTIQFSYQKDTLVKTANINRNFSTDEKAEQRTIFFTDRQLYRPGQTLYFKGLQLETYQNKSKLLPGATIKVDFEDENGKNIKEEKFVTNEFGTFNGSIIIPQNILQGNLTLATDDGEISVRVEEYKRPTFTINFDTLKSSPRFNDSVKVTGKALALSGYGLSNARVAYHITRNRDDYSYSRISSSYKIPYVGEVTTQITTDTVSTDNVGQYTIKFKAIPGDLALIQKGVVYTYSITATITDGSGETRTANTQVRIGKNDINFYVNLPDVQLAQDSAKYDITLKNLNGHNQPGILKTEIFALRQPDRTFKSRLWNKPDLYLLSKDEYSRDFDFAYGNEDDPTTWQQEQSIFNSTLNITGDNNNKLDLTSLTQQKSGLYKVIFSAQSANGDTASYSKLIQVRNKIEKVGLIDDWVREINTQVEAGLAAEFWLGIGEPLEVLMEIYQGKTLRSSQWMQVNKTQSVKIPVNDQDNNLSVQFLTIYQNRQYVRSYNIRLKNQHRELKLHMLSFRNKLIPGQKEEWKMQISSPKNEKIMAEVLAGMYDASLDQIASMQWWNYWEQLDNNNYFNWYNYNFVREKTSSAPFKINSYWKEIQKQHEHLNLFGYNYWGNSNSGYQQYLRSIENKKAEALFEEQVKDGYEIIGTVRDSATNEPLIGVSISIGNKAIVGTDMNGQFKIKVPKNSVLQLNYIGYNALKFTANQSGIFNLTIQENWNEVHEVVVRGYTPEPRYLTTGSTRVVSGAQVLDAPVANVENLLQGKVAGLDLGSPGMRGSLFVRGLSSLTTPDYHASEQLVLRSNFKETAFFYPQLRTDENGQILINFTIPESLTKWRFQAFAHTKELATGSFETSVITQKQLMISANMPRFFREGDTITVAARLANLSKDKINGQVKLELFNALNMQPVQLLAKADEANQTFELTSETNLAKSFQLIIPANLDAITYRISAISDLYTDGEENTVPVLSNQMLVTESMPMIVRAGQQKTFILDKLVNQKSTTLKSKNLTLEYTQNPAWYAVQAMPYLVDYPYDCSEQIFSRYYANSFAAAIVKKNTRIKQVFDEWNSADSQSLLSNLERNPELKSVLLEETPWLQQAQNETEQKKRIALLFDLNQNTYQLKQNLEKLQQRQLPNGGFPWFGGDRADRYITQHMIAGIGQLQHLKISDSTNNQLNSIRNKALSYLDNELLNPKNPVTLRKNATDDLNTLEIHGWYTRSYFPDIKTDEDLQLVKNEYLRKAIKQWKFRSIYEQALIALTLWRNGEKEETAKIIRSLNETAKQSPEMGMHWSKNQLGWFWYQSPVETQALMIELFTEANGSAKAIEEMKIWLLRHKQTNHWRTTKATAAATYALLMKGEDLLSSNSNTQIKINNTALQELKPDIKSEAGTGYLKTNWTGDEIKPAMGKVQLHNTGNTVNWGALYWQYTEKLDKITSANTEVELQRKYFIEQINASGIFLQEINAQHQPKVGDVLKVVVYLKAKRDFDYIHLKDMRPAGTEPVDVLSSYKYQDGLYYYQVTKDVATNFFMSRLNKGNYVFEYRLRVAQAGNFATGISSIQSMYSPEFNAHSEGGRLEFGK